MRSSQLFVLLLGFVFAPSFASASIAVGDLLVTNFDQSTGWLSKVNLTTKAVTQVTVGSLIIRPYGVAIGPQGQIYLSDSGADGPGSVFRIDPDSGVPTVIATGDQLVDPYGISVAANGGIFVTDVSAGGTGAVIAIDPGSGSQTLVAAGGHPLGIAVDPSGNLLVARFGRVDRMTTTGSILWSSSVPQFAPATLCVNAAGIIFVWGVDLTASFGSKVYVYASANGAATLYANLSEVNPGGVVFAPTGDLYMGESPPGFVFALHPDGTQSAILPVALVSHPHGLALFGYRDGVVPARQTTWGSLKDMYR